MTAYIRAPYSASVSLTKPCGEAIAKRVDSSGSRPRYDVIGWSAFGDQRRLFLRYRDHVSADGTETVEPDAVVSSGYPVWVSAQRFNVTYFDKETDNA